MIHIDEIEARLKAGSPNGRPRIVIIEDEPSRRERITGAIAIALVGLTAGYLAGHFFGGPF